MKQFLSLCIFFFFATSLAGEEEASLNPLTSTQRVISHLGGMIDKSEKAAFASSVGTLLQTGLKVADFHDLLGRASIHDDSYYLDFLLAVGCNIKARRENGATMTVYFVERVPPTLVEERLKYLIGLGMPMEAIDDKGRHILHHAAMTNNIDMITYLTIGFGTDVDVTDRNGQTSLMVAARLSCVEAVEQLLTRGADSRLKDAEGRTALDLAQIRIEGEPFGETFDNENRRKKVVSLLKAIKERSR